MILKWLDQRIEFWLCFFLYSYMAIIVAVEVFRRYCLKSASSWGEETAIYVFIWMTYIAAARGVRGRRHLAVEILRDRFGRRMRFFCLTLSDTCFFILAVVIAYYSLNPIWTNIQYNQKMMGAELPMALASASITVGWGLIVFRVVQRFFATLRRFRMGKPLLEKEAEVME
jgi:C4-dicarboxylate transporter, DctQ subunit